MAEPSYTSGGYPVSPLERFVTGFESGYNSMLDIKKKSQELKTSLAYEEAANERLKNKAGGGGDMSGQTREAAYDTGGTTGSGGEGGSGSGGGGGGGGGGKWGEYAQPVVDFFKKSGYSDAAVQAIMGNGLAEGGFANNWLPGDHKNGKPTSFGHWQFHEGGELNGYRDWASKNGVDNLQDSVNQARYIDYRLSTDKKFAGFKDINDAKVATNRFHIDFERPANQTPGLRFGHLASAQKYLSSPPPTGSTQPPGMSTGSIAPVPGAGVQVGGPGTEGTTVQGGGSRPEAPAPVAAPPAALNLSEVGQRSLGSAGLGAPRATGRPTDLGAGPRGPSGLAPMTAPPPPPQQHSAIGGPGGQPSPDIYNRPQAPPPPSVVAQLVQQGQQYLPQQYAALAPRDPNALYGGLT